MSMADDAYSPEASRGYEGIRLLQLLPYLLEDPEKGRGKQKGYERSFSDFLLGATSVGVLAVAYMMVSTGLITFNKFFMNEGRFPFVIFLGMLHMSFSFLCNLLLYRVCPSLYPALADPAKQVHMDRSLVLQVLLPIAGCFGAQLVLSNMAFMHSSLAFLQMMKQSNVVLVYMFSLALSLEEFSWKRAVVLLWIVGATGLTIHGELNFSFYGFAIQGFSMLCESLKLTLQSYSLSAEGRRLDALTFVMLVSPLVLLVLLSLLLALHVVWPERPSALMLPSWSALVEYWRLLVANGCLAFAMNVAHALLVKQSSATAFILIGVVMKDVAIVAVGSLLLGELLSPSQVAGFALQLVAILVWSSLKAAPGLAANSLPGRGTWGEDQITRGKVCEDFRSKFHWLEAGMALVPTTSRMSCSPSARSTASTKTTDTEGLCGSEENFTYDDLSPCRLGRFGEGL